MAILFCVRTCIQTGCARALDLEQVLWDTEEEVVDSIGVVVGIPARQTHLL